MKPNFTFTVEERGWELVAIAPDSGLFLSNSASAPFTDGVEGYVNLDERIGFSSPLPQLGAVVNFRKLYRRERPVPDLVGYLGSLPALGIGPRQPVQLGKDKGVTVDFTPRPMKEDVPSLVGLG